MRESWRTKEFGVALGVAALAFSWPDIDIKTLSLVICAAANAFTLARWLYKKNRGQLDFKWLQGEFWTTVAAVGWFRFAVSARGLDAGFGLWLAVGTAAVYIVSRGAAKSIGVRTQWIK